MSGTARERKGLEKGTIIRTRRFRETKKEIERELCMPLSEGRRGHWEQS